MARPRRPKLQIGSRHGWQPRATWTSVSGPPPRLRAVHVAAEHRERSHEVDIPHCREARSRMSDDLHLKDIAALRVTQARLRTGCGSSQPGANKTTTGIPFSRPFVRARIYT
jgi:hypothetical protein